VLPPPDANLPGGVFRGCRFSRDDGAALLMTVDVPLPTDYRCDVASPRGCWIRVKVSFPGGVCDFTTWSAQVNGNPVGLIEQLSHPNSCFIE
jgi:hypothetical protein